MMRSTSGAGFVAVPISIGWIGCGLAAVGDGLGDGVEIGLAGTLGVVLTTVEAAPVFTALVAETLKKYKVPFVRPETVAEVAVLVPSAKVAQVDSSVEYSIK
jgi:hypothetical protein